MRNFWLFISVLWLWTCSGGGGSSPTEPQEPAPVSNFTATPTTLIQGQAVTFTSTSTGTITSYAWNVDNDPAIEGTTATYEHTYTEVGTYSVTLTVTGPGGSNPKTVADMITVSTAAPTPTTETSQTVQEDGSTTIGLTATDPNGQAVTFAITTDPTNGTATLSGTEITYTPNANFYGTDSFDYTASNGTYTSDPVTITITVEGEDDGNPTTNDVSATTDEDTVVTVNLDATEIDGDNYSFSIVSQPSNGTLGSVNGNQVEYTPTQDWNGTDTFTFEATDDRTSRRNIATATITVNAVNDAPVANDVTASMDENKIVGRYQPVTITLDATDVEGDALTYFKQSDPTNGTLGSFTNNQVVYTPTQDFNGEDTFIYKATDGNADSNGATVTITIASVNDAPVTQNVSFTTDEDTPYTESYTAYVSDIEGDNLTITAVTNPTNGTATCDDASNCTYTPNQDFNGTDSFTYKVNDGELDSNISTVSVTINPVNDAPVANDMTATLDENKIAGRYQSVTIFLNATDVDGDDLTYSVVGSPTNGTLGSINGNQIIYTPTQDYNGEDTFTYKANDGTVDSNTATVTITINSVNDVVTLNDKTHTINEDDSEQTVTSISVGPQTDIDGDTLTYSVVRDVSNGSLGNFTNGTGSKFIKYVPDANFNGTDTFTFKANDGTADSNTATVTVTVNAVNDAPETQDQSASTNEDTAVTITLSVVDVDTQQGMTRSIVSSPSNGSVVLSGSGNQTATYTPTTNWNGTDTFTWKANDGELDSNVSTVTITVAEVNDIPVISDTTFVYFATKDNVSTTFSLSEILNDDNSSDNTFSIVEAPSRGSASIIAGTTFTYSTENNLFTSFFPLIEETATGLKRYKGGTQSDTIKIKSNDGDNDSNVATIKITYNRPFDILMVNNRSGSAEGISELFINDGLVDGNFLVMYLYNYQGSTRLVKMDTQTGDLIWEESISSGYWGDLAKTASGDYIFTGGSQANVGKTSSSGNNLGYSAFPNTTNESHDTGVDLVETFDGHFIIGLRNGGLYKVDGSLNGEVIWRKQLNYTGYNFVDETNDNGLITVGYFNPTNEQLLTKTDSNGNVEWTILYPGSSGTYTTNEIFQTSDGGYMFDSTTVLYKVDSLGNQEWTYSTGTDFTFHSFVQTSDGGYIVGGNIQSNASSGGVPVIVKLTSSGSEEWSVGLNGNDSLSLDYSEAVIKFLEETSDGGFILGGHVTTPQNSVKGLESGWIMKIDSQGNRVWPNLNE